MRRDESRQWGDAVMATGPDPASGNVGNVPWEWGDVMNPGDEDMNRDRRKAGTQPSAAGAAGTAGVAGIADGVGSADITGAAGTAVLAGNADIGSGTMAGMMLVMVAAVALAIIAAAGNLLICRSQARAVADLSAIAAAVALRDGSGDPCALAERSAQLNGAALESCSIDGEDVRLAVAVRTRVPFVPNISVRSRAGPVECG
ncbi:pilus biosynthesis protein TadE [Bifidobacterium scardovii]|uniref:Pilus biosynthesis protein TadE n=3 Tax=Bifidobacterium scardovii TaxID=158787 RepID=A0A087DJ75_9BIFI|nr:pilus biosynthesis protein TadE [Bifidobacterium scardovii]